MADLIIKPATGDGNKLIIQNKAGTAVLTTSDNADILPPADNTVDLGSTSNRWKNIYTTDLHLNNDRGDWTVIEEEDYLTLRNNKTDKVYKLIMEEIK